MQLSYDRTGFPWLPVRGSQFEIALFPITKVQFERYLAQPDGFGDEWYETVLATNPRASWRKITNYNRRNIFLTGIFPEEALEFIRWLGEGYDLPTTDEWRMAERVLRDISFNQTAFGSGSLSEPARAILRSFLPDIRPVTWDQLALFRGGVAEWVRADTGVVRSVAVKFGALGSPEGTMLGSSARELIEPVGNNRSGLFGFRPVRRIQKEEFAPWL